jgi:hypothetical protein
MSLNNLAELYQAQGKYSDQRVPASPIGAALDLVARWEAGITLA